MLILIGSFREPKREPPVYASRCGKGAPGPGQHLSCLAECGPSLSESGPVRLRVSLNLVRWAGVQARCLIESGLGGLVVSMIVVLSGVSCRV
jgi:hypothetical protein